MLRSLENVAFAVGARKNGFGVGSKQVEAQPTTNTTPTTNLKPSPNDGGSDDDPPMLTTTETLAEGQVYLNEHPRRRPPNAEPHSGPTLTDLVAGTVGQRKGAYVSSKPTYHNASSTPRSTLVAKGATSATVSSTAKSSVSGMTTMAPPPLSSNSDPTIEGPEEGPTPTCSQVVFGQDTNQGGIPNQLVTSSQPGEGLRCVYGMPKKGASVPTSSASCNIDHDDDLVRKIVMAFAKRQVAAHKGAQPEVEDVFMRSVMSMTKLPEATKAGQQGAALSRNKLSIVTPTKIPVNHWVLRETIYDTRKGNQKEDARVFSDLKQNKRTIVFPSANPGNRPEVYYLAQTLDLMFRDIPEGYRTLASGEECYRILEAAPDAEMEQEQQQQQEFPQASTVYYDAAQSLWEVLDAGITEISRQVSPVCTERGALLEALRTVARDVGTTSLEVMQFCKEEVRSLLMREAELSEQVAQKDQSIEALTKEVSALRAQLATNSAERSELEEIKARYEAMRQQVHVGTAMLIRDNRLPEVLSAIEAGDTDFLDRARASKSLESNPHLSLLASGVAGIDLATVKALLEDLGPIAGGMRKVGSPANHGAATDGPKQVELDENGNPIMSSSNNDNPEMYQEAVKYLLTLDEAVRAIDLACLPFYQRALFDNPALCVSVASGKWRTIAKAIGRHEMILEQREKQWRDAVKVIRREEASALNSTSAGAGMDVSLMAGSVSQLASQFASQHASQFADPVATSQAAMLLEGSIMEKQIHFMQQFRTNTRKLLGAAFFGTGGSASPTNKQSPLRGEIGGNGGLIIGSQSASPEAKKNAETFLNAKLMLPATYSIGPEGLASMFKDTRAVMVEIVQRLCALATSAQLKELSRPPMLPPTEPDEPCPLCSRVHLAEIQKRRRDEAMVALAEAAEAREIDLSKQIEATKKELEEANARIARAMRQAKDFQGRNATLEKQNVSYQKELQVLKDWGMGVDGTMPSRLANSPSFGISGANGRSGSGGSAAGLGMSQSGHSNKIGDDEDGSEESEEDEGSHADGDVGAEDERSTHRAKKKTQKAKRAARGSSKGSEEAEGHAHAPSEDALSDSPKTRSPRRSPRGRKGKDGPLVIELVINCSCCGGGSQPHSGGGSSVALKTQQLLAKAPRPPSGQPDGNKGGALARLMGGYAASNKGSSKALLASVRSGNADDTSSIQSSVSPSQPHWRGGGTKVAGIPSDPTELLQAISQGILGNTENGGGLAGGAPSGPISMRQAAAAMGIRAKRASAIPESGLHGEEEGQPPKSFLSEDTISNNGDRSPREGGSQAHGPRQPQATFLGIPSSSQQPASNGQVHGSSQSPIPGVSDLALYTKAERRGSSAGGPAKEGTHTKAFWNYVATAIGGPGPIGGAKEDEVPEKFPINPQYSKVRSRVNSIAGPSASLIGLGRPGVNYPLVSTRSQAVLGNLLNADDTTEAVSTLRFLFSLSEFDARRQPKSLGWLLKFMTQFYKTKLVADLVALHQRPMIAADGSGLITPTAFMQNLLQNMYGHKVVIASTVNDLAIACSTYSQVDPRVSQFVRFLTDTSTLLPPKSGDTPTPGDGEPVPTKQPISEASRSLFFFSRLSRAVDNCTTGLSYSKSAAGFCHDEEQSTLQIVSLARVQAVLQQTELIKKPYASALWDVVGAASTVESDASFRSVLVRNGYTLLQDEAHPKDWPEDTVKRGRMTCPKIVFLAAATQFEAILREQQATEGSKEFDVEE